MFLSSLLVMVYNHRAPLARPPARPPAAALPGRCSRCRARYRKMSPKKNEKSKNIASKMVKTLGQEVFSQSSEVVRRDMFAKVYL